jgi:hypothetical protein
LPLPRGHALDRAARSSMTDDSVQRCWARRAVYRLASHRILVTEVFLPVCRIDAEWHFVFATAQHGERRDRRSQPSAFPCTASIASGRNYAAHVRGDGQGPAREPPFFSRKPADAVVANGVRSRTRRARRTCTTRSSSSSPSGAAAARSPIDDALDHVFGLRSRQRSHASRPAVRARAKRQAVGRSQGLRSLGADHGDTSGERGRPLSTRRNLAAGQRRRRASVQTSPR